MWPLRRNVQYNKRTFLQEIFFFVLVIHLLLLGLVFVCDTGKYHQEKFVMSTNQLQSTVVFMPLKKRVIDQKKSSNLSAVEQSDNKNRQVMSHDEYTKKLAEQEKKKSETVHTTVDKKSQDIKSVEKQVVKKEEKAVKSVPAKKSPTRLQATKEKKPTVKAPIKPAVKKPVIKKPATKNEAVKATPQTPQIKKTVEEKKEPEIKKVIPAPEKEKEQATAVEKTVQPQDNKEHQSVQDLNQNAGASAAAQSDQTMIDLDNVSFVGSLDLEMMQIKEQIEGQIAKYYKPPVGISKKAVCQLTITVGALGKADRVVINKASGSVANDICARAALLKITFPKEVIGKEIIIELGQS